MKYSVKYLLSKKKLQDFVITVPCTYVLLFVYY